MHYVMGDVHGEYDKFLSMLEQIDFTDDDLLFVLGDVLDRGPEPVKLLTDLSMRSNVYLLLGNHELMALDVLRELLVEITEENCDRQITADLLKRLLFWQREGGEITLKQLRALPKEDRLALLEFLEELPAYEVVDVGDVTYILVHAGLGNYAPERRLSSYTPEELTCMRPEPDTVYYDGESIRVLMGHTPTRLINGTDRIVRSGNAVFLDCGATFGGKLACLCLETQQEFYV